VFWSAAILTALGSTFGTILELDFTTSILISAAVAVGYTLLGGLWAVAYTDVVQLVCILLGLSVALPFALEYVGGISTLWPAYQDRFGAAASLVPPIESFWGQGPMADSIWTWVDFALMLILGGIPWQVYFQRVLACRDEKTAVRLSLLAAVGCLIMAVPAVMLGAIGATVDWQSAGATPPEDAVLVLPHVLRYLTPPIVGLIGLGAVSAAVMSSVDSSILSASSMFAWNVYRPLLRPEAGQRELRRSVRASVLVVGTLATVLALRVKSVYGLWFLCADFVYVILFPQLVTALYFKRSTRIGAIAGMVVGLFFRLAGGVPELGIPPLISKLVGESVFSELFQYKTLSMLASLATIFAVSWLTPGGQKAGNHPVGAALS
jgi:high affinity choline transporter 7